MNLKKDFPIFEKHKKLVYLDSGATSLKPTSVIDAVNDYNSSYSANVHRGIYDISEQATAAYEGAREKVAKFIGAKHSSEIVFTRGTTESINLVSYSLGRQIIEDGDEIVTTIAEHHSNFVPWQQLAFETGAYFKVVEPSQSGTFDVASVVTKKTKIVALTYVSNVLGIENDIRSIAKKARKKNPHVIIVVDAAQAAPHIKIDVQKLDCDFIAFSGHKMCGPTGIGVLWGKKEHLESMWPFQYGGDMIAEVAIEKSNYAEVPYKFEAGTPNISGGIGLGAAIDYLSKVGLSEIHKHTVDLATKCMDMMSKEFGKDITILNKQYKGQSTLVSFVLKGVHPHDIAHILNEEGVAVRAGHHCAMPLHTYLGHPASTRASFYLYNNESDIDALIKGLKKAKEIL